MGWCLCKTKQDYFNSSETFNTYGFKMKIKGD